MMTRVARRVLALTSLVLLANIASASPIITPALSQKNINDFPPNFAQDFPGAIPGNLFDISNGVQITSNSPVFGGGDIRDMFGGKFGTTPPDIGDVRFADRGSGQIDTVFFTTPSPVKLAGYNLWLLESGLNRSVVKFELLANNVVISTANILSVGANYFDTYGSELIQVSDTFATPVTASSFEAIFYDNNGQFPGARVQELDGFTVPEPGSLAILVSGLLCAGGVFKRRGR
jgi:hypothetical protein